VSLRDGSASDARTEAEREDAALEQATRLVEAFERVLAEA
jgi:hypothetical protein